MSATKPISRKVTAGTGIGGLVTFGLLEIVTTYRLDLPANILALIGAVITAGLTFAVGYAVRHGWLSAAEAAELRGEQGPQGDPGPTGMAAEIEQTPEKQMYEAESVEQAPELTSTHEQVAAEEPAGDEPAVLDGAALLG